MAFFRVGELAILIPTPNNCGRQCTLIRANQLVKVVEPLEMRFGLCDNCGTWAEQVYSVQVIADNAMVYARPDELRKLQSSSTAQSHETAKTVSSPSDADGKREKAPEVTGVLFDECVSNADPERAIEPRITLDSIRALFESVQPLYVATSYRALIPSRNEIILGSRSDRWTGPDRWIRS